MAGVKPPEGPAVDRVAQSITRLAANIGRPNIGTDCDFGRKGVKYCPVGNPTRTSIAGCDIGRGHTA